MINIAQSLQKVRQRMSDAAKVAGREASDIQLLAVSKTKPIDMIHTAYQAGQSCFGENYLQDALPKISALHKLPIEWHYIGKLQSNKCKDIAKHFNWVHSVDRLKHVRLLNQHRSDNQVPLQICLQVNLSGESSKNGIDTHQTINLAKAITPLARIQLRGLMTMPNPNSPKQDQIRIFQKLAELKTRINQQNNRSLDTLSMGMSDDLELAIAAGSTMVRIGTDIFGPRN